MLISHEEEPFMPHPPSLPMSQRLSPQHVRWLFRLGILMFLATGVVQVPFAYGIRARGWDIPSSGRLAAMCGMFVIGIAIIAPLFFRADREHRLRGFIFYWVAISTIFNFIWQLPLSIFRGTLALGNLPVTPENYTKYAIWWGVGFGDSHY